MGLTSIDPPTEWAGRKLNQQCVCVTLDRSEVAHNLANQLGDDPEAVLASHAWQQFFSDVAVFVPAKDLERMVAVVQALEAASALPEYRRQVLARASDNAQANPGPAGVFMGYDFHLGEDAPRLIEVNTNAGGAFLNAVLARAQLPCCSKSTRVAWAEDFDDVVIEQFEREWQSQRGSGRPASIAIVDDQPAEQYLYPEFRLAQQLFRSVGIDALIVSPSELKYELGALYSGDTPIDMVYNRLTDFALEAAEHAALRSAWLDGGAVITPNPFAHALLADKRNLVEWSDPPTLQQWGLSSEDAELLRCSVPRTVKVTTMNADALWQQRRQSFFKPVAGYGSKGAYRGSKITRSTFAQMLASDYVAQAYVPPSERVAQVDGERKMLKVDVRLYTYRGKLIMAAARLYQGQTTNFRTPGGGFAPIFLQ